MNELFLLPHSRYPIGVFPVDLIYDTAVIVFPEGGWLHLDRIFDHGEVEHFGSEKGEERRIVEKGIRFIVTHYRESNFFYYPILTNS